MQNVAAKLHQIAQPTRGSVHVSAHLSVIHVYEIVFCREAPWCSGWHWCSRSRRLWVLFWYDDSVWILHVLPVSVGSLWIFQLPYTCQLATLHVNVSMTSSTCLFLCCGWSSNTGTLKCCYLFHFLELLQRDLLKELLSSEGMTVF